MREVRSAVGAVLLEIPQFEQQVLSIDPGASLQFEVEPKRYSYFIVLEGCGTATVESVTVDLDAGNVISVVPYSPSIIENRGSKTIKVLRILLEVSRKKT